MPRALKIFTLSSFILFVYISTHASLLVFPSFSVLMYFLGEGRRNGEARLLLRFRERMLRCTLRFNPSRKVKKGKKMEEEERKKERDKESKELRLEKGIKRWNDRTACHKEENSI